MSGMNAFYDSLPVLTVFEDIADPQSYRPLPDGWVIGLADVVSSTAAIAQGRYKAVNLAGAAAISAVSNRLGTLEFPYVFTGDGMCCALGPDEEISLRETLAATVAWVGKALDLSLRGATVPVATIRAAGHDVRVARFQPSPHVTYAMFSGGGLAWAEAGLKSGALPLIEPRPEERPELAGLTCRFKAIPARLGIILSLIVAPAAGSLDKDFGDVVNDVLGLIAENPNAGRPLPSGGPSWGWPPEGWEAEARLHQRVGQSLLRSRIAVGLRTLAAAAIIWSGKEIGGFSPARYRRQLEANSDFRKYEDGLMMTIDCTADLAAQIEARLATARSRGIIDFGLHRQASALLTCVVPSPAKAGHVHFVDGASGGYTLAATSLKQSRHAGSIVKTGPHA